ncbi:MAG: DUF2069 domain-containing protein [Gammaproteobacteria bacterium]|jgi:uncharacterized membrane protein
METARRLTVAAFAGLVALGLAWELWLAPLRPGGSMLALKVLPLLLALPAIVRGRVRTYQWWSMGILLYLAEGLVRATSDRGASALLAGGEIALSCLAFGGILAFVRAARAQASRAQAAPSK